MFLKMQIDLGVFGIADAEIDVDYSAGSPGVMYMPNGDPGYPDEPAECIINSFKVNGIEFSEEFDLDDAGLTAKIEEMASDEYERKRNWYRRRPEDCDD